jgi:hypothetical protein
MGSKMFWSLVGYLIYLTNTKPNIVLPVSIISRFIEEPSTFHLPAAKKIMWYLQGTKNHVQETRR